MEPLVLTVELLHHPLQRLAQGPPCRDGEVTPLARVAHVQAAVDAHAVLRNPLLRQPRVHLLLHRPELGLKVAHHAVLRRRHESPGQVVLDVHQEAAQGAVDAGPRRDDDPRDVHGLGHAGRVEGPRAPEGHQGEVAGVEPLGRGHEAHGVGHAGDGNLLDGHGGVHQLHAKRVRDPLLDGLRAEGGVDLHVPAQELLRVQPVQQEVGVRDGGLIAPLPVARGPGIRAHGAGPHAEGATLVDPRHAAAARANGLDVGRGEHDGVAVLHVPLVGGLDVPLVREGDVGARAPHVQADGVLEPALLGDEGAGDGPCRRPRVGDPGGVEGHGLHRHDAAPGVHGEYVPCVSLAGQPSGEVRQVLHDHGRQGRVDDRGGGPLVLEHLREDFVGAADEGVGVLLRHDLPHAGLVGPVHVGVDEGDGDGLDVPLAEDAYGLPSLRLVQGRDDIPRVVDALPHLQPVPPLDVGGRYVLVGVPDILLRGAANLQDVPKAWSRDEAGAGQLPGDQGVGANGGAVGEQAEAREVRARLLQPVQDPLGGVLGRGGRLRGPDLAGVLVKDNDIGKRPPHVDASPNHGPRGNGEFGT